MSDRSSNSSSGGIGFFGLLTIVFITLKLTHYIDWSWWWVLSPLLFVPALLILIALVLILVKAVPILFEQRRASSYRHGAGKTRWFWQKNFWNASK